MGGSADSAKSCTAAYTKVHCARWCECGRKERRQQGSSPAGLVRREVRRPLYEARVGESGVGKRRSASRGAGCDGLQSEGSPTRGNHSRATKLLRMIYSNWTGPSRRCARPESTQAPCFVNANRDTIPAPLHGQAARAGGRFVDCAGRHGVRSWACRRRRRAWPGPATAADT